MPTLFRFLMIIGLVGGIAYAGLFSLATFVDPKPREITVNIPPSALAKHR